MELRVSTAGTTEAVDVTERVEEALPDGTGDGTCTVFVPHTTAGVVVNEAESGLLEDVEAYLGEVVPADRDYRHDRVDDNAPAHLRAILAGESVTVPVENGSLALGTWQSILLLEFDGPRDRRLRVVAGAGVR